MQTTDESKATAEGSDGAQPRSPLHQAALLGDIEGVKALLIGGADVNAQDSDGYTAIHMAASAGDVKMAKFLLSEGVDVSVPPASTALHIAAYGENKAIVKLLISAGSDVNGTDRMGQTPIFKAAESGNKTMVRLLLSEGASTEFRDVAGQTAADWAMLAETMEGYKIRKLLDSVTLLRHMGDEN